MTLGEKQEKFTVMLTQLLVWCEYHGYKIRLGEVWRTSEQAAWNAAHGLGIKGSLHTLKLAVDFAYVRDAAGKPLLTKANWQPLGDEWKLLGGSWGGDFKNRDVYHFSLSHNGVR